MLSSITFENFKRFRRFSVRLGGNNILVGPNNSGKSTILDAIRALSGAWRYCQRRLPQDLVDTTGNLRRGYELSSSSIPIDIRNIHTDYREFDTTIRYRLMNGRTLELSFPITQNIRLYLDDEVNIPETTAILRKLYPLRILSVPTLAPFEEEESVVDDRYFHRWWGSRRSSRLFRNYWHRNQTLEFETFQELVETTWDGVSILPPERDSIFPPPSNLQMFYKEGRIDREIYWAGFGFQVWLQILTHLVMATSGTSLIIDEPDIHLHSDLQRRLLNILMNTNSQVVLATHSVEIINDCNQSDIIVIDPSRSSGRYTPDIADLQAAIEFLGSTQNIELSRLAKGRKILFFEGRDFRIIKRIARRLSFVNLSDSADLIVISIGGESQHRRVRDVVWTFEKILQSEIKVAALFDRDYKTDNQVHRFSRLCT